MNFSEILPIFNWRMDQKFEKLLELRSPHHIKGPIRKARKNKNVLMVCRPVQPG
jgi:hypothetical protein